MPQEEARVIKEENTRAAVLLGFREGDRGTHSSRTMMLSELSTLFDACEAGASREEIQKLIVTDNVLGKKTNATRRATFQRLTELYALDPGIPLYRVFRRLWGFSEAGRPLLAILFTAARDPLLRSTIDVVLEMRVGESLEREQMATAIRDATGERFNEKTLGKIVRNVASSWTQSGHLSGRSNKIRAVPVVTPANTAYAFFLGYLAGVRGPALHETLWARMLGASDSVVTDLAMEATRRGWMTYRRIGRVIDVRFPGLLSAEEEELIREQG